MWTWVLTHLCEGFHRHSIAPHTMMGERAYHISLADGLFWGDLAKDP